jgi:S1-C subfamily serine protease
MDGKFTAVTIGLTSVGAANFINIVERVSPAVVNWAACATTISSRASNIGFAVPINQAPWGSIRRFGGRRLRGRPAQPAFDADVERGYIIMEIDRQKVGSVRDYQFITRAAHASDPLTFYVYMPGPNERALRTLRVEGQ